MSSAVSSAVSSVVSSAASASGPAAEGVDPGSVPRSPQPRRTRAPRWLDLRLVVGVVLVVGSVLLGAVVVSRAAASTAVWSTTRDLPQGAVLAADDLVAVDVRLGSAADAYVTAGRAVVGSRLATPVSAGQLLPVAALDTGGADAGLVTVSIPFDAADAPSIERGDVITVWLSTPTCASVVLLDAVGVQDAGDPDSGLSASNGLEVVVSVSPELADRVVTALSLDDVTLRAGVLSGGSGSGGAGSGSVGADATALPDITGCGAGGSAGSAGASGSGVAPGSAVPSPSAS